jgi:hypothetical protein
MRVAPGTSRSKVVTVWHKLGIPWSISTRQWGIRLVVKGPLPRPVSGSLGSRWVQPLVSAHSQTPRTTLGVETPRPRRLDTSHRSITRCRVVPKRPLALTVRHVAGHAGSGGAYLELGLPQTAQRSLPNSGRIRERLRSNLRRRRLGESVDRHRRQGARARGSFASVVQLVVTDELGAVQARRNDAGVR